MRRKTRTKVKKGLIIAGITIGVILLIIGIIIAIKLHQQPEISYDDGITCKNYFKQITINLSNKEVKRDNIETSLKEEFNLSDEEENLAFSSMDEMRKLLSNSVFDISENGQTFTIKNLYQTKSIIVKSKNVKETVDREEVTQISENLYVLSFYSEKLTKAMYNYYKDKDYIEKIYYDDVTINKQINDISQTMYGGTEVDLNNHHSLGATVIGLDNYNNIINENGNPKDIVIGTIGYGINYQNEFFNDRISDNYYNFVLNNKDISETIAQGSRIAEVLVDSTTNNVKIMPLVTVTEEGYTSTSSILKAIAYAAKNSDVICYELINTQSEPIDLALESCFKENVPVCSVSSNSQYETATENSEEEKTSKEGDYPANHGMTIAVSSLDREMNLADYSGKGDYIDFSAPSTDVEEIFSNSANISRWSGAQYSNAQIAAIIALIKTYSKDATILDVYNFLRNFSEDLGDEGKDELYGYGCPKFQNLTIGDIDKTSPEFKEVTYENDTWEVVKQVKIVANDNIRMKDWAITKNENGPDDKEWNAMQAVTPDLDVSSTLTENGKYYIWIRDIAGNTATKEIQIDKIDNTPPEIAYTINKDTLAAGYVTITVTAEDSQSGLYDSPFSWDKITWSQENSTRTIKENGRYKVYAEDNLGNISEKEILVDCFPQAGTFELKDGNIITNMKVSANWIGNTNNDVEIELNKDLDIAGWQITTDENTPSEFVAVEGANVIVENQENNNNNSSNNTSLPNNVVIDGNIQASNTTAQENTQPQIQVIPRTEPIVLHTTLDIDKTYYFWTKDSYGNTAYQAFVIHKAVI
ncbi:MAG: S8 family serine peptidase [Clostridia bacterium]